MKRIILILVLLNIKCFWTQTLTPKPIPCIELVPSVINNTYSGLIQSVNCIEDQQNSTQDLIISGNQEVILKAENEIFLDGEVVITPNTTGNFFAEIVKGAYDIVWFDPNPTPGYVPQYEKMEIGIKLPNTINEAISNYILENNQTPTLNPFNPHQINVRATITSQQLATPLPPQLVSHTIYGFYYKEFERNTTAPDLNDWTWNELTMIDAINSEYNFRLRYAPTYQGQHTCTIEIAYNDQTFITIGTFTFDVGAPVDHGFVKVSASDTRFFERD